MNIFVRMGYKIISFWGGIATIAIFINDRLSGLIAGPAINMKGGES